MTSSVVLRGWINWGKISQSRNEKNLFFCVVASVKWIRKLNCTHNFSYTSESQPVFSWQFFRWIEKWIHEPFSHLTMYHSIYVSSSTLSSSFRSLFKNQFNKVYHWMRIHNILNNYQSEAKRENDDDYKWFRQFSNEKKKGGWMMRVGGGWEAESGK